MVKLQSAYRSCGAALSRFASALEQAQSAAGTALRRGQDAEVEYRASTSQIRVLLPADRTVSLTSAGLRESSVDAATVGLGEDLRYQIRAAARRAQTASTDLGVAGRLAGQAAALRGSAESTCAAAIDESMQDIKNKSWFHKAWHFVTTPFRSWDGFVHFAQNVALAAGIAALILSGPVGWALGAAALAAGAVVLGDALGRYAVGRASIGEVGLDALGVIPGGQEAATGERVLGRLAALTRDTPEVTREVSVLGEGGRGAAPASESALGGLGDVFENPRVQGVGAGEKPVWNDPIDVATGDVLLPQTDLHLPGLLALTLRRVHVSSYRAGGYFGTSWASTLDQRAHHLPDQILIARDDGALLSFPLPRNDGAPVFPAEGARLALTAVQDGFVLTDPASGITTWFTATPGHALPDPDGITGGSTGNDDDGRGRGRVYPITAISEPNGHRIDILRDTDTTVRQIRHSGGYLIDVQTRDHRITGYRLANHTPPADPTQPVDPDHADPTTSRGVGPHVTWLPVTSFGYDQDGNLSTVYNSSGRPLYFRYDHHHRLTRWQDRNGTWYEYAYDHQGRCTRTIGADDTLNGTLTYHHDEAAGRVTTVTDSLGHATVFRFNHRLQVTAETDPTGATTTRTWTRHDQLLTQTNPAGHTTTHTYDATHRLTTITRADHSRWTLEYDADPSHRPTRIIQPDGGVWTWEYDTAGNPIRAIDPAGGATSYQYRTPGIIAEIMDVLGARTVVESNRAGLTTTLTDPLGRTTRLQRDAFGRVTSLQAPDGGLTTAEYSPEGWLSRRRNPDGSLQEWRYDGEGNVVQNIDPLGRSTTSEWTHFDRPSARTTPDGARTTYTYDTNLRLTAVTDPLGRAWRFERDTRGDVIAETDVNDRRVTYRRDVLGRVVEKANGAGEPVSYRYDEVGNLIEKASAAGITAFEHDRLGRLVRATGPDGDLVLERDRLGRVVAEIADGQAVRFDLDAGGRRVSRTTPSGRVSEWTYDAAGQVADLRSAGRTLTFTHDTAGRETRRQLGPAAVLDQAWSIDDRLLSQTVLALPGLPTGGVPVPAPDDAAVGRRLQERRYRYDQASPVLGIDDHLRGTRDFVLDPTGRPTGV
ncbi:MAG TPA: DUF6531 domain-containing protein, partial [Urbifossiella sp.]|nr:DUF6531 domain-containing protein [Urbifossiella sp.]